jgi:hypothetical protein
MKILMTLFMCTISVLSLVSQVSVPRSEQEDKDKIMGEAYWKLWNPQLQSQIDENIEKYRKADGEIRLSNLASDTEVKVEQISHDFLFGAHIFNFDQLGKTN